MFDLGIFSRFAGKNSFNFIECIREEALIALNLIIVFEFILGGLINFLFSVDDSVNSVEAHNEFVSFKHTVLVNIKLTKVGLDSFSLLEHQSWVDFLNAFF